MISEHLILKNFLGDHTPRSLRGYSHVPHPPPFRCLCTFCSTCENNNLLYCHCIMHTPSEQESIHLRFYTTLLKHLFELKLMIFLGIVICPVHIWGVYCSTTGWGVSFRPYTHTQTSALYCLLTIFLSMVSRTPTQLCIWVFPGMNLVNPDVNDCNRWFH